MINTKKIPGEIFFKDEYLKQKLGDRKFEEIQHDYERVINRKLPFRERFKAFITGQNKLGRSAGHILDIITLLSPYGRHIETGREAINIILNRQQNQNPMLSKLSETSTKAALLTLASFAAIVFGVEAETLQILVENIWVAVAGIIAAGTQLFELFRKENPQVE